MRIGFVYAAAALLLSSSGAARAKVCQAGAPMSVRFYDVGQGLSALVTLPDGRHILVDAGPPVAHGLVPSLQRDLAGKPLDLLWITHQHIDHVGGADNVLQGVKVLRYVDNGRGAAMPEVKKARIAAQARGTVIRSFGPGTKNVAPLPSTPQVSIRAVLPSKWVTSCNSDENQCSIGLRIDYCKTSFLFVGDAEFQEEASLSPLGTVTVLQLGHHGSDTSSSSAFLAKVKPKYAVVSAGHPGEGSNVNYCHPRKSTMLRVTQLLGGPGAKTLPAFDATVPCDNHVQPANWPAVPVSDRIFATERDGDVLLTTTGNGDITRPVVTSARFVK